MMELILRDLLDYFGIDETFPDYLYNQTFNEVFLDGELTNKGNNYKLVVTTRQDVTHQLFLKPDEEFPVIVLSILPNGRSNGIKFGQNEGEEIPISKL